jgi:hypothetical protein
MWHATAATAKAMEWGAAAFGLFFGAGGAGGTGAFGLFFGSGGGSSLTE